MEVLIGAISIVVVILIAIWFTNRNKPSEILAPPPRPGDNV